MPGSIATDASPPFAAGITGDREAARHYGPFLLAPPLLPAAGPGQPGADGDIDQRQSGSRKGCHRGEIHVVSHPGWGPAFEVSQALCDLRKVIAIEAAEKP